MDSSSAFTFYIQGLRAIQVTRYAQLTSSCIIIFDHIITFDDEVDLIWKSSWSLGKTLFLFNRYYALAASIFNNYALFAPTLTDALYAFPSFETLSIFFTSLPVRLSIAVSFWYFEWQGWTGLVGCMIAEGILQIRLYALYSLDKKILALMLVFFVLSSVSSAYVLFTVLSSITASAFPVPGGSFCVPRGVSRHFYAYWIPLLSFETLLCVLAFIRGVQTYKSNGPLFRNGPQLVGILVRDSLMYFFVICSAYLTCLLMWIIAPPDLIPVPIGFTLAMSCVLANRVVLNVREVNRDMNQSQALVGISQKCPHFTQYDLSFCSPGVLSQFEMQQLRTMPSERHCG